MSEQARPVFLLTDFGTKDPYVGLMKSVLVAEPPTPDIVDLTHEIPPQNEVNAAFLLDYVLPDLPENAIVLLVVDPEVGTERRIIAVEDACSRIIIAPDTGMVDHLDWKRAHHVTNESLARDTISSTFHGRDWFAPVGGYLSRGGDLENLGPYAKKQTSGIIPSPDWNGQVMRGEVLHVDRFGNLISNIPEQNVIEHLNVEAGEYDQLKFRLNDHNIDNYVTAYERADRVSAVVGSFNRFEVAKPGGSAADELDAGLGSTLNITR